MFNKELKQEVQRLFSTVRTLERYNDESLTQIADLRSLINSQSKRITALCEYLKVTVDIVPRRDSYLIVNPFKEKEINV